MAVERGDVQSAYNVAVCYGTGYGVDEDLDKVFENDMLGEVWEPLDAMVLNALGVAYGFGRGTEQDIPQAIEYFDRAIEYDSDEAKQNKACFKKTLFGGWKMR